MNRELCTGFFEDSYYFKYDDVTGTWYSDNGPANTISINNPPNTKSYLIVDLREETDDKGKKIPKNKKLFAKPIWQRFLVISLLQERRLNRE